MKTLVIQYNTIQLHFILSSLQSQQVHTQPHSNTLMAQCNRASRADQGVCTMTASDETPTRTLGSTAIALYQLATIPLYGTSGMEPECAAEPFLIIWNQRWFK